LLLGVLLAGPAAAQKDQSAQAQSASTTRSPHGPLTVPCQNCHTLEGWKPIRAVPEFDHNTTRFPLRGLHQAVACTQCHTKPVFTNVGKQCAACHADIHKGQLGAACEQCHSVKGWNVQIHQIKQHNNRFPLLGAHAALECDSCHKSAAVSQFAGLSTNCYSCHAKEFQTATPSHTTLNFPTDCTQCHGMDNWMGAKFDHLKFTGFALTGAHATLDCVACHVGGKYTGTPATCVGCHLQDFNGTNNPPHAQAGFPQTCQQCHSTAAWNPATFDHSTFTKFPLTGAHINVACNQCHVNGQFASTPTDCASCHMKDFNGTTNPNHAQSGFPQTCQQCHNTTSWSNATFDHNSTGFALTGAHAGVQCAQCHVNNNYSLTSASTACVTCHLKDFQGTTQPNHVQSNFSQTCQQCHTTTSWANANFDHSSTGFPLTGAHTSVLCSQCHVNGNYTLTSANTTCVSCHLSDFTNTSNPNHAQQGFPQTCQQCHNTTSWMNATFDHNSTGFPLTGAHTTLQCAQCHVNNNYNLTSTACVTCHLQDYKGTTDPNHVQANMPQTCQQCHTTTNWGGANFDHSTTGFPLTGAHTTLLCSQCHLNGNYALTSANTACASCHQADFNNTNNPSHVQANFPTSCQQCHNTTSWGNATFDHSTTGFPLTGAHTTLQCTQCHINGNYNLTSANTACVSCHQTDYNNTHNPSHVQAAFPTTCQQCHNTTSWGNATFDHSTTGFPLTGAHTTLQCTQCHINGNYNLTSANTACISCHQTDFNNTNNPPHASAGFPTTCQTCHTTASWSGATFNHTTTGFALTGAHTSLQCSQCHVNNNYSLTSGACVNCHLKDFQGTTNPNHVQAGFPQTCDQCHTTTSWGNGTFDHSTTGWALTGAHTTLQCVQCHVNGNYSLTSANTACVSCHQTDYTNTNNPNHAQVGFPTTCDVCHSTASWANATFNHNNTTFPLTGAHTTVACTSCHVNNNYTTLPTACYGCHQADYNGTTNPNHTAAGFPTTCQTCHTTTSWAGATFNHTYFPTSHGGANGVCSTCHTNPNDYSVFTCTNCHLKPQTDQNHQGVNGYVYNSANCYQCHKNGSGG
jgi:hypothetical protein